MGREATETNGECVRCGDYGFTIHRRRGRRHPYPCPTCKGERDGPITALDAQRALVEHGDDLRTTYTL